MGAALFAPLAAANDHVDRQPKSFAGRHRHRTCSIVAKLIGVGPGQFVALVAISQLTENFQHANFKCSFGWLGDRLWVSPRFHRLHHGVGIGHESAGKQTLGGHNFGVLFPWWDMLFGTANFSNRYEPTGVRDQVENGRDYGQGFWAQSRIAFTLK